MGAAQPIKGALEQGKQPLSLSCLQAGASRASGPHAFLALRHTGGAFALEGVEC